jgi:hypothetical protein
VENINEKTKRLRREVAKTFMLLFVPHLWCVCVVTSQVTTDQMGNIKWQCCWFATYFTITFFVYVFAPKIIKKRNSIKEKKL